MKSPRPDSGRGLLRRGGFPAGGFSVVGEASSGGGKRRRARRMAKARQGHTESGPNERFGPEGVGRMLFPGKRRRRRRSGRYGFLIRISESADFTAVAACVHLRPIRESGGRGVRRRGFRGNPGRNPLTRRGRAGSADGSRFVRVAAVVLPAAVAPSFVFRKKGRHTEVVGQGKDKAEERRAVSTFRGKTEEMRSSWCHLRWHF